MNNYKTILSALSEAAKTVPKCERFEDVCNDKEHKFFKECQKLLKDYYGKDLSEIGTQIKEMSDYNLNYYALPNGTVVYLKTDEYYETDDVFVYLEKFDQWVKFGQQEHGEFSEECYT